MRWQFDLTDWSHPQVRAAVRAVVARVHDRLDASDLAGSQATASLTRDELATEVGAQVRRLQTDDTLLDPSLSPAERRMVWTTAVHAAVAELGGLGRLQRLLDDDSIQDLHVNGYAGVWAVYTDGRKVQLPAVTDSDDDLVELGRRIARNHGVEGEQDWSQTAPVAEVTLASGHRIELIRHVTVRPSITIRRPNLELSRLDQLVALGTLNDEVARFLSVAVAAGENLLVAGGTGAGKTTTMRALVNEIGPEERVVTIEDVRELNITHEAMVDRDGAPLHPDAMEILTRRPNAEGAGGFDLADGLRASKRMNPDRVIVGEVRSVEAAEMLDAMLGEAGGSLCTVHAESARAALDRLVYLAANTSRLAEATARKMVADAVDVVVWQHRDPATGRRYVAEVVEIDGIDGADGIIRLHEAYRMDPAGRMLTSQGPTQALSRRLAPYGWRQPPPLAVVES